MGAMRPIATGEFLVDREAMHHKLRINKMKLWKHRAYVLWDVLGRPLWKGICSVAVPITLMSAGVTWLLGACFLGEKFLGFWLWGMFVFAVLPMIAFSILHDFWEEVGQYKYQEIKHRWGRLDEERTDCCRRTE